MSILNVSLGDEPPIFFSFRSLYIFFVAIFCATMILTTGRGVLLAESQENIDKEEIQISPITSENLKEVLHTQANKSAERKIQLEQERIRNMFIERMENVFASYGGYMTGLADNLYDNAIACGGDPILLFAIAGNESGFGRIPYKYYNPFGYLDGRQYNSWEEAIDYLSCKISTQHLAPCNNEVYCVIRRYGGPDTPQAQWISNINWFMNKVRI